jgi:hypothetical protein
VIAHIRSSRARRNVVVLGASGVGKLTCGHARLPCHSERIQDPLLQRGRSGADARSSSASGPLAPDMHRPVSAYRLLIIDEIGYLPMSRGQANLFLRAVAQCHERGSMIFTSNLTFRSCFMANPKNRAGVGHDR